MYGGWEALDIGVCLNKDPDGNRALAMAPSRVATSGGSRQPAHPRILYGGYPLNGKPGRPMWLPGAWRLARTGSRRQRQLKDVVSGLVTTEAAQKCERGLAFAHQRWTSAVRILPIDKLMAARDGLAHTHMRRRLVLPVVVL
jgi:hypothetical protein